MVDSVTLTECPRDAFQGLPRFIPTEIKIQYMLSLIEAGFRRIDFGSFVSPKAVPQLRDTNQVFQAIQPHLGGTYLIAIIPNVMGIEEVIQSGGIRCAGYPLSVSETFQQRNLRQNFDQAWRVVEDLVRCANDGKIDLIVYLSMAFGNPYGEPWSPELVSSFVERLVEKGVRQISLADTVGRAPPSDVGRLFAACQGRFPSVEFGVHLHSRPDRWEGPVMAAYHAGCRRFDAALHGIGGCPFAEDQLVGNIPTECVIERFDQLDIASGLEESSIRKPLALAREILKRYG